jgi:hypothetical protein
MSYKSIAALHLCLRVSIGVRVLSISPVNVPKKSVLKVLGVIQSTPNVFLSKEQ